MMRIRNFSGFSLIEMLVTLVLVAIGVLGMVALQGRSIQYMQDSVQRNNAVSLVNDLTEIIRANPDQLFTSAPSLGTPYYGSLKNNSLFYKAAGAALVADPCVAVPKTAREQLGCWIEAVNRELPGGNEVFTANTYICRSSARGVCGNTGSMIEVQLAWRVKEGACPDEDDPNKDETVCYYRTRVEL